MCWKCGSENLVDMVSRSSECPQCHSDLHCCRNCIHYMPGSHYDCHETVDELVGDKEHSNFCGFFSPRRKFDSKGPGNDEKKSKAVDAFNALFS